MVKTDLHPPQSGPGSNPVLYGVAAGLAELFPPITGRVHAVPDHEQADADEAEGD